MAKDARIFLPLDVNYSEDARWSSSRLWNGCSTSTRCFSRSGFKPMAGSPKHSSDGSPPTRVATSGR